jgi:hypothetical protein
MPSIIEICGRDGYVSDTSLDVTVAHKSEDVDLGAPSPMDFTSPLLTGHAMVL